MFSQTLSNDVSFNNKSPIAIEIITFLNNAKFTSLFQVKII